MLKNLRTKAILNVFFLFLFTTVYVSAQSSSKQNAYSDIDSLIKLSRSKTLSIDEKFVYSDRARRLALKLNVDSIIVKANLRLSSIYKSQKNFNLYKKINLQTLSIGKNSNDTLTIARSSRNLGSYYYRILESDSAYYYYYNAEKAYYNLNDIYNSAAALINMAIIQKNEKDFVGSENTSIKALSYLESILNEKPKALRFIPTIYNNLAVISSELNDFEKAVEHQKKAIEFANKNNPNDKKRELHYINNLAVVYQKFGSYSISESYFKSLMEEKSFLEDDQLFYARVLDNYARNKFLLDINDSELPNLFINSLAIKDSIDDKGGAMRSCIHIADYYLAHSQLNEAKNYANRAYKIAKRYNLFDDQLETLLLLSKIEKGDNALAHTQEYIALNDSLQKEERAIRNKFARIEFETDKIEAQNIKISRERMLFLGLAIGLGIAAFLVYVIISQRAKNKELKFSQEQQKANEEIYNLMLSQQDKIEEGRTQEKKRISEDLHDGILGRLFGTRLSLDSLNFSTDAEAVKNRGQYIDELKSIEQEIRRISHDLNTDFVAGTGYLDIVETLIETQTQAYQLDYDFIHKDEIDWEGVSNKTKIHFYRMIQESLQNIYKHANASHVAIRFEIKDGQIYLNIVDNGEGFVVTKAKKGIGLKNIKSRVDELKGELFINSQKDTGTSISINVPL